MFALNADLEFTSTVMTNEQILHLVHVLCSHGVEQSGFEFKLNNSDPAKLGANLSAVANAACLASKPFGYVVYGVNNADGRIVGTEFDHEEAKVGGQALLLWLAKMISPEAAPSAFTGITTTRVEGESRPDGLSAQPR